MGNKVINTTSVKLGIYETSTDSQLAGMLGDVKEMEDGRKFRLCKNSSTATALVPGKLVQAKADTNYSESLVIVGDSVAGDTTVVVTVESGDSDLEVNALKDGYFCIDTGTGHLGHGRKIKENTAAEDTENTTLTFYDALTDAVTGGTDAGAWVFPLYKDVVLEAASGKIIGVSICDVAASEYFWAQTTGACPMVVGSNLTRGLSAHSDGSGLATVNTGAETAAVIGTCMQTQATGLVGFVWLNLE